MINTKKMLIMVAIVTVGIMTSSTYASPFTQVQTTDILDIDLDTFTYLFDQFDDQGGALTLLSVRLDVSLQDYHAHYYTNNTEQAVTLTVHTAEQAYGFGGPSGLGVSLVLDISDMLGDYEIPAGESLLLEFVDEEVSLSATISSDLAAYIGAGTVGIAPEHDGVAWSGEAATSGLSWDWFEMDTTGTIALTYTYIPEPATMVLLGLGGLALIRKRRKA